MQPPPDDKVIRPSTPPALKRVLGYFASTVLASLFHIAWVSCDDLWSNSAAREQFTTTFGASIFFFLAGGFALVFLLLILPWIVVVSVFARTRYSGRIYFTLAGAILIFIIGCLTASLIPKPLFVPDQTFAESILMAVKREGISFVLAGGIFGASYWFLCERHLVATRKALTAAVAG